MKIYTAILLCTLACCTVLAAAYEQAPSPLRARQLAALSRRHADLSNQLEVHQTRIQRAAVAHASLRTSVAKFEKLLAATESACAADRAACSHVPLVRQKLRAMRDELKAAHAAERRARDDVGLQRVSADMDRLEHRIASVKSLYYGYPSIAPRPKPFTFIKGKPVITIPRPQKPVINFPRVYARHH